MASTDGQSLPRKLRIADGILVVAEAAGVLLAGSGAAVVAFLGQVLLAIVLGAIALGIFLRLSGRRKPIRAARRHTSAEA